MIKKTLLLCLMVFPAVLGMNGQAIEDCSDCDKRLLTREDLEGKSVEELSLLRNEIYARNGHVFSQGKYNAYFIYRKWYAPASSNEDIELSETETKNVAFIKSLEDKLQRRRDAAVRDLKKLKDAFNNDDREVVESFMSKMREKAPPSYESMIKYLKETLSYIDLDDIHWNKTKGLYKVSIDNGYLIRIYDIEFVGDRVTLSCGDRQHTEIFGDFNDGYSDYDSINEYSFWWGFEMLDTGIKFDYLGAAG